MGLSEKCGRRPAKFTQLARSCTRPPDAWHWSLKRGSTSLTAESCIAWSRARLVADKALRRNAPALSAPSPPGSHWKSLKLERLAVLAYGALSEIGLQLGSRTGPKVLRIPGG